MALKTWREIQHKGGLITDAGNAEEYETGSWRSHRPIIDMDKCTHCMICWVYCPDSSIQVKEGKVTGIDLAHCKGCGICAHECPRKAISMVEETSAKEGVH